MIPLAGFLKAATPPLIECRGRCACAETETLLRDRFPVVTTIMKRKFVKAVPGILQQDHGIPYQEPEPVMQDTAV